SDFNLYYYNTKTSAWEYKGKDRVETTSVEIGSKSGIIDSSEARFFYNPDKYSVRIQCTSDMTDQRKFFLAKKKPPLVFEFRFTKASRVAPELMNLRGITWKYFGKDAQEVYKRVFGLKKVKSITNSASQFWGEATMTKNDGDDAYRLELIKNEELISIDVIPVLKTGSAKKSFGRKWSDYLASMDQRIDNEQKRFEKFQSDSSAYYAKFGRYYKVTLTGTEAALRTFTIDGFGIWNCDKPFKPSAANVVYANFVDQNGAALKINGGYMVEKKR